MQAVAVDVAYGAGIVQCSRRLRLEFSRRAEVLPGGRWCVQQWCYCGTGQCSLLPLCVHNAGDGSAAAAPACLLWRPWHQWSLPSYSRKRKYILELRFTSSYSFEDGLDFCVKRICMGRMSSVLYFAAQVMEAKCQCVSYLYLLPKEGLIALVRLADKCLPQMAKMSV